MEYTYLIVLLLPGRRWIGPRDLLPRECFSISGRELKLQIQVTEYSQSLIPIAFIKQTDVNICEIGSKPIFMSSYRSHVETSTNMLKRLEQTLARNRLWVRHECVGQYLDPEFKTIALR